MKLLFDHNLSYKLVARLADLFPNSVVYLQPADNYLVPQTGDNAPPYHAIVRGVCDAAAPILLPAGCLGMPMELWHAACCLARQGGVTPQRPGEPEPIKARRPRSKVPQPFVGLPRKPPCALWAPAASHPTPPPPMRPEPMPPPPRRPRAVDTSRPCCPHAPCD